MSEWKTYKLGDIAELRKEQIIPNGKEQPYIGLEHIEQQSLRLNGVGSSNSVISNKFKFYSGDILYGKLRPYFRKVYKPKFEGVCSTDIYVIRNKKLVDKDYLFYLVATEEFTNIANSGSSGTRMPRADWKQLEKSEWQLPDITTQKEIAQILSSLDDKIELNLQMNQTLEAMAQAIFKEWFVNFNFPGFDGELVDGLPKGWRMGKLGDISKNFDSKRIPLSSRQRAERKGEYPYYGAASILDYVDDFIFDGTYLLMGEDGTVRTDEGFPVLQYVWGKFWVNNHTHVLQGLFPFSTEYLYLFLAQTNITNLITGAVQPKINQGNMNKIKCVLPTEDVLNKFYEVINPIFDKLKTNSLQIQSLTQTRDTLLPKLMSGQLEVV